MQMELVYKVKAGLRCVVPHDVLMKLEQVCDEWVEVDIGRKERMKALKIATEVFDGEKYEIYLIVDYEHGIIAIGEVRRDEGILDEQA
jgi:hypothetical protein